MLNFREIAEMQDLDAIRPYLKGQKARFCDYTVGTKYQWRKVFKTYYAIYNDTLIMKESSETFGDAFYYPIGKDEDGALLKIEEYCMKNHILLKFCCVDDELKEKICGIYPHVNVLPLRDFSEYVYPAENFVGYKGKKLSGQRNHVNKFKKLYQDYRFESISNVDVDKLKAFLRENCKKEGKYLKDEYGAIFDYFENLEKLGQVGLALLVGDKIVGVTAGEVVDDTLIVHVEKADRTFEGAYPTIASAFVNFVQGVKFVNREEDCGDLGLRTSKLQYKPCEIKTKYLCTCYTLFDRIKSPVAISVGALTVSDIEESDKHEYARLYLDDQLNVYWGYDYRDDLNGNLPTADYFYGYQKWLKEVKEEYSLAVRENGKMIGELVLHNFTFRGGVEMGYRFFRESQGKGYATISATALKKFVESELKPHRLMTRCDKRNTPSRNLIGRLGFESWYDSQTHHFFKIDYKK